MGRIRRHLRGVSRALALCVATTFIYLLWACILPLMLVSKRATIWWRDLNFRSWSRLTALVVGLRVETRGMPPRAPFFLVSNHLSYMDIVAFASQLDSVFIAKSEVAQWPVLGLLCRSIGTIFVDRNSRLDVFRVNRLTEKTLGSGRGVLLFPEGTSTAGSEVLPFHSALLEPAVRQGCPVSFATVSYRVADGQSPAHESVCWWGEMAFLPHFYRLLQLESVEATLVFGSHSIRADDRKILARQLWQAVNQELNPVVESCETFLRTHKPDWVETRCSASVLSSTATDAPQRVRTARLPQIKRALEELWKAPAHSSKRTLRYSSRAWKF